MVQPGLPHTRRKWIQIGRALQIAFLLLMRSESCHGDRLFTRSLSLYRDGSGPMFRGIDKQGNECRPFSGAYILHGLTIDASGTLTLALFPPILLSFSETPSTDAVHVQDSGSLSRPKQHRVGTDAARSSSVVYLLSDPGQSRRTWTHLPN
ncbi:hypothetical protein BD414DRAFT_471518 [Trametes punicea]|nr:hypothetical protein BD414DRAFT_471518 [Trametes punicea]